MINPLSYFILILLGICGFSLALYIRMKKKSHRKMVCPFGSDCDMVIHSKYSKFLGIPVEILGLLYYGIIVLGYIFFLFFPYAGMDIFRSVVIVSTVVAFLFSIYLTLIQAFALKQWCTWCLISAALSTAIFFVTLSPAS